MTCLKVAFHEIRQFTFIVGLVDIFVRVIEVDMTIALHLHSQTYNVEFEWLP